MAFIVADRVKETTTSTGTGTITLGGSSAGFQSFAVIGNGNTTPYVIQGTSEWEVGIGTYTSSGTTLSRDTVLSSSNNGNKVNFSAGSKDVFVSYPASLTINGVTVAIGYMIDGDGDVITTGTIKPGLYIPFNGTITSVTLIADVSGSIVVDIWKTPFGSYPPVVGGSICASAKPTLSSALTSQDTTLTGWTTTINAGDTLLFNVDSASTVKQVTVILRVTKT